MKSIQMVKQLNTNARFGLIALLAGGLSLSATIWLGGAVPLQLASIGALLFGQWAYAQEAGLEKPLTKLVLIAFCFCVIGFVMFQLDDNAKAGVLFVFASFLTILFWALAMLHRPGPARTTGKVGAMAGGISIAILISGHVFAGLGAALGLGVLRSVTTAGAADVLWLVQLTCVGLAIWSSVQAWLLFKRVIASAR